MKETFPEKVNVYFELRSTSLKLVEDKQTYHTGLKKRPFLRPEERVGDRLFTHSLGLQLHNLLQGR
jgi:hypothetical protein